MSRGEAADLARFKVENPLWSVRRAGPGSLPGRAPSSCTARLSSGWARRSARPSGSSGASRERRAGLEYAIGMVACDFP
jgi:hypothetical protein